MDRLPACDHSEFMARRCLQLVCEAPLQVVWKEGNVPLAEPRRKGPVSGLKSRQALTCGTQSGGDGVDTLEYAAKVFFGSGASPSAQKFDLLSVQ